MSEIKHTVTARTLEIKNALQHADTLASRHHPDAHIYLDLADALITGSDARVSDAIEACIESDIHRNHNCRERGCVR